MLFLIGWKLSSSHSIKVAKHSFQVPMPNLPFILLNIYALAPGFFAGVKVKHRSVYSRVLAEVYAVAIATGLVKDKAYLMFFFCFYHSSFAHYELAILKIPSVNSDVIQF